jgi:hypothetical protein
VLEVEEAIALTEVEGWLDGLTEAAVDELVYSEIVPDALLTAGVVVLV